MLSVFWMPSTGEQGICFGGVSLPNSTGPWNPNQSEFVASVNTLASSATQVMGYPFAVTGDQPMTFSIQQDLPGATFTHTFSLRTGEPQWSSRLLPAIMGRLLCHWLLSEISERGLPETGEVLLQLRDHYRGEPQTLHFTAPTVTTVPAVVGSRERSALVLTEE